MSNLFYFGPNLKFELSQQMPPNSVIFVHFPTKNSTHGNFPENLGNKNKTKSGLAPSLDSLTENFNT